MTRKLEIGPGKRHLKGHETVGMEYAGVQCDVFKRLPYEDGIFDKVIASHVIEHALWYETQDILTEWSRILKTGGMMEIWTPDFGAIIDVVRRAEDGEQVSPETVEGHSVWMKKHNPDNDPYIWANYRMYSIDSTRHAIKYNRTHSCMFTFKHLRNQMSRAGLTNIEHLKHKPPYDHGWAQLGVAGYKL